MEIFSNLSLMVILYCRSSSKLMFENLCQLRGAVGARSWARMVFGRYSQVFVAVCCIVLQCVAVCCSVLQCVAVCCRSVLL